MHTLRTGCSKSQIILFAFILYGTEAIPLSKSSVKLLYDCVKQAVAKVFSVHDNANIDVIRQYCDLPYIDDD